MFEEFSRGYYFGRMYVVPYDGDRPVMQRDQHASVRRHVYAEDAEEPTAASGQDPLVMKLDTSHIAVHGEAAVPADTLAVPSSLLDRLDVDGAREPTEVFLAKADRAEQLMRFTGYGDPDPFGGRNESFGDRGGSFSRGRDSFRDDGGPYRDNRDHFGGGSVGT
ncbi:DUF5802 family protein [Haloarchaeobius sp. TZWWS8]|uniref:DUF5802 family protein n=1 Tax=Haloarchaeobius sp. TZWWS8 TaxID=3446121 RepID=UPI003EBFF4DD